MVKTKIRQLINSPPIQFGISSTEKKTISNFEVQNDLNELVLDSIGDAILLINPYNYEILSANKIASQLFKLKKEKMIGKTCYQVTHHKSTPCIPPNDVCPLQEMLKTQKPVVVEHSHFNEENRKIELEISVYPIKDKDGKIIQVAHIEKDITKRKTQEREEKTLSNELNAIIDGVGDLLFVIDKNRVILRVNKTTCDVFNKKPEELIGKHCYEIVHGTESPYCNCPATKTFQTKSSAIVEINDPTLGMPLLVTTSPILDEQGNVAQVIHVAKDITIIKQAEMESQVAATFFDAASDSILVHDLDGHIVYFNEAAYKTRGYTREEFQTLTINDLEVPGNPRFFGAKMNELLEKGQARFEALNLCRDKKTIPVEVHAQAVVFDEEKLILSVARDISERNAAQEKLKQAEDMYKTFLTEANVLVQSIDHKGSFIFVNEEWKKSLGYCNEDIKNLSISDVIRKDHIQNCLDVFSQVVKGASIRDVETVFVTKSGKEVFVSGNACPIFKKGKFFSTIAFFEDISERKITEKNLAESSNRIKLMNEKLRVVGSLTKT